MVIANPHLNISYKKSPKTSKKINSRLTIFIAAPILPKYTLVLFLGRDMTLENFVGRWAQIAPELLTVVKQS